MSFEFKYVPSCYNNDLVVMWGTSTTTANRGKKVSFWDLSALS